MRISLLLFGLFVADISSVHAAPQCSQQTTRGTWVYSCEGEVPVPGAPARMLGTCIASPSAFWSCSGYINVGRTILKQEFLGQAHNNDDCTGTITYAVKVNGQPASSLDVQYVVFDGGDSIKGLPTNSGGVLACSLNRMNNSTRDP